MPRHRRSTQASKTAWRAATWSFAKASLCWKFIQRWLRENAPSEVVGTPRTRKELFRAAARLDLISDPRPWFDFGDARNLTSHTYDEAMARVVFDAAGKFLPFAQELLNRLEERND